MAQQVSWQLHIVGPEGERKLPLVEGDTQIGRRPQNEVVLAHQFVSGRHALLTCSADGCALTDLGSTNGTSLAGEAIPPNVPISLEPEQTITIGPFQLTLARQVVETEEPEEELAAEPADAAKETADSPATKAHDTADEQEEPSPLAVEAPAEAIREAEPVPTGLPERAQPPPPSTPPPEKPGANGNIRHPDPAEPPPGMDYHSRRLLAYLPGIYHTDFMGRFLAIFESILAPIEWTVDNFDLFLSPRTAPAAFLPWLANWYTITYDTTWSEAQRRALLAEAPEIYARRGTRWALARVLEIYTGRRPEIVEFEQEDEPFSFTVRLPFQRQTMNITLLEQIIDAHKPAHTIYRLRFLGE